MVAAVPQLAAQVVPAVDVYLNHGNVENALARYGSSEFGDEIKLLDNLPRKLSDFTFDYYGDFKSQIGVTATLTLYKNDGPDIDPSAKTIPAPGTMLYQSDPILLQPGYHEAVVSGLAIDVPSSFTWTVSFNGLTGAEGNRAGLLLENPPTIGQSFDDFWQRQADGSWNLFRLGSESVANFGARARAFAFPISFPNLENLSTVSGAPTKLLAYKLDSVVGDPGIITITAKSDSPALVPDSGIILGGSGLDRTIQIFPVAGEVGLATIELVATSSTGLRASTVLKVRVTGAESPIVFSKIPDQKVAVGQATPVIPFEIVGLQQEGGLLGAKITSSNKTLVPDFNVTVAGDFVNFKLTVQVFPKAGVSGETTITIDVTAGSGAKGSTSFKLVAGESTGPILPEVGVVALAQGSEPGKAGSFTVSARGTIPAGGLTVLYGVSGSATAGFDYSSLSGSIVLPQPSSGDATSAQLSIPVLDDLIVESPESVTISLKTSAAYQIGAAASATIQIADNDAVAVTAPKIVEQPLPKSAARGETVVFSVSASGSEPLAYQWFFNNAPLNDEPSIGVKGAKTPTLTIGPIENFHAGSFHAEVSNTGGKAVSEKSTLSIVTAPALPTVVVTGATGGSEPSTPGKFTIGSRGPIPAAGLGVSFVLSGTAQPGLDFRTVPATVIIPPPSSGDGSTAIVEIPVLDDTVSEAQETVVITLTASPNYILGTPSSSTLTITDDDASSATKPLITLQPKPVTVAKGGTATFEVTATGPEPLKYQWKFRGNPLPSEDSSIGVKGGLSRILTISPVQDFHAGPFTVEVSNQAGSALSDVAQLTLESPNKPPRNAKPIENQQIFAGTEFSLILAADVFTDPDTGDSLVLSASNLPGWLKFDAATRRFSGTPADSDAGTVRVTVVATDKQGLTAETSFSILVKRSNKLPTISSIADQRTVDGRSTAAIPFRVQDVETAPSGIQVTAESSDVSLLASSGIVLGGQDSNRTITLSPVAGKTGVVTITLTATDVDGGTSTQKFKLTVEPGVNEDQLFLSLLYKLTLNRDITAEELKSLLPASGQALTPGELTTIINNLIFGDEFSRNWVQWAFQRYLGRTPSTSEFAIFGSFRTGDIELEITKLILSSQEYASNAGDEPGALVKRWMQDLQGSSGSGPEFERLVRSLELGTPATTVLEEIITGRSTLPHLIAQIHLSYLRRTPSSSELTDLESKTTSGLRGIRAVLLASPEFQEIARKGALNSPPIAQASSASGLAGSKIKFALAGFDPDGDALTFEIISGVSKGTLEGNPPSLTYVSKPDFAGVDELEFVAKDGKSVSQPTKFTFSISANQPPVIGPIANFNLADRNIRPIVIKASDRETPLAGLKFEVICSASALFDPASLRIFQSLDQLVLQPQLVVDAEPGITPINFEVKVTDANGASASTKFTITPVRSNSAPFFVLPNQSRIKSQAGQLTEFAVEAVDRDRGQVLTLLAKSSDEKLISTSRLEITGENGKWKVSIRPASNVSGTAILNLEVSDNDPIAPRKAEKNMVVEIFQPAPVITVEPSDISVRLNEKAIFEVKAEGTDLAFQWKKGNQNIPGATTSRLEIARVTPDSAGLYKVEITNAGGKAVSKTVRLTPLSPPIILNEGLGLEHSVREGGIFDYLVTALSDLPMTYQWFKLGNNSDIPLPGMTSALLSLKQVKVEDSGAYYCNVSNAGGTSRGPLLFLSVYVPVTPVKILVQPGSVEVDPGSPFQLSVTASGREPFRYTWRKNGGHLRNSDKTLRITSAQIEDSGTYDVTVIDANRTVVRSEPAIVRVRTGGIQLADNFADRQPIRGSQGNGRGLARGATVESAEPPLDTAGSASVWTEWVAPRDGSVSFSTAGSDLPTSINLFKGTSLSTLQPLGSGNFSAMGSRATVKVLTGDVIAIRIQTGPSTGPSEVVLSWRDEPELPLPVITGQPGTSTSVTITLSGNNKSASPSQLLVTAQNPPGESSPLKFEWFRMNREVEQLIRSSTDADGGSLPTRDLLPGVYFCRVSNARGSVQSTRTTVFTRTVVVRQVTSASQISSGRAAFSKQDLVDSPAPGDAPEIEESGSIGVDTTGAVSSPGEPAHCGITGGASYWMAYKAPKSGTLTISTDGSTYDTVLAAYTGDINNMASLVALACDDNGGSGDGASKLQIEVAAGNTYWIAADGVGGETGVLFLEYQLAPGFTINPIPDVTLQNGEDPMKVQVSIGGIAADATLSVAASSSVPSLLPTTGLQIAGTGLTRTLSIQPSADVTGSAVVTVVAASGGRITSTTFKVIVTAPNTPPQIAAINNQSLVAGTSSPVISLLVSDSQQDLDSLKLSAKSSNPTHVPTANILFGGSGANRTLTIKPTLAAAGTVTISVDATDTSGAVGTTTFNVEINPIGGTPTIVTEPRSLSLALGTAARFEVEAGGTGPLGYQWNFNGIPIENATNSVFTLQTSGVIHQGSYTVDVSNSIGTATSSAATLTVLVPSTVKPLVITGETIEGQFAIKAQNVESGNYSIDASSNLENWESLGSFLVQFGVINYLDPVVPNGARFYRVRKLPNP